MYVYITTIGTYYSDIEYSIPSTIENIPHNAGSTVVTWPETAEMPGRIAIMLGIQTLFGSLRG
jgi:hypothetical protein